MLQDLEETALHLTARYGGIEDMRLLLLKGADPNVRNKVCKLYLIRLA